MCGIAGFIDFSQQSGSAVLKDMTNSLTHRGPDAAGYEVLSHHSAKIGLGHRRLSIIDLSEAGSQPMHRNKLSIIFNGEIYNYREIREELQSSNVKFQSSSDTEVVLAAYEHWGADCVHRFRGMFAFVIYDHQKQEVLFFRDRIGVKPLFIYRRDGLLLFASELKAFHQHPAFDKSLDQAAIDLYFSYGFVPSPKCIFRYVEKLLPGHYLRLDLASREENLEQYWDASSFVLPPPTNKLAEPQLLDEIEYQLQTAFEYRMVADVPVGVFLSGGYDSSLVAALLQKDRTDRLNTFTIGFEDPAYNEAEYAESVAKQLGTNHTTRLCTRQEAQALIPEIPFYYDEPFADSSAIPTLLVSKVAAEQVKVALSADGGDELFSGYSRNLRFQRIHQQLSRLPGPVRQLSGKVASSISKLKSSSNLDASAWWDKMSSFLKTPSLLNIFDAYPQFTSAATRRAIIVNYGQQKENPQQKIKESLLEAADPFNALLSFDYQSTLTNDMLVKVDRATMANSLEGREPMLDHHLYEYLAAVSSDHKMKGGTLKYLLKEITHRHLPKAMMERPKKGFGVPINDWLKTDLAYLIEEHLSLEAIGRFGILRPGPTRRLVDQLLKSDGSNNQLWLLLNFQLWCNRWL